MLQSHRPTAPPTPRSRRASWAPGSAGIAAPAGPELLVHATGRDALRRGIELALSGAPAAMAVEPCATVTELDVLVRSIDAALRTGRGRLGG